MRALIACLALSCAAYADEKAVPPDEKKDRGEAVEVHERLQRWLTLDSGADDVRSGRVAPVWRQLERDIGREFHPAIEDVTRDSAPKTVAKQLINAKPRVTVTPRTYDPSRAVQSDRAGFAMHRAQQVAEAHAAYQEPRDWKRVEIEAEVGADGKLLNLRVVTPSGIRELDQAAMNAVKTAVERLSPQDGHRLTRWAAEAAATANLPAVGVMVDEVSGRAIGGGVGVDFEVDENGKITPRIPFQRRVHTRVTLESVIRL